MEADNPQGHVACSPRVMKQLSPFPDSTDKATSFQKLLVQNRMERATSHHQRERQWGSTYSVFTNLSEHPPMASLSYKSGGCPSPVLCIAMWL